MIRIDPVTSAHPVRPLAVTVALAMAVPGSGLAETMFQVPLYRDADMSRYSENNVELGVGYNSEDSFKFGEYTGLDDKGAFLIGNGNVRNRFGSDGRGFVNAYGFNLGLPSRSLGAEVGNQGQYWLNGSYEEIPRYQFEDTRFIHDGLGGTRLTLPPGFTGLPGQPPTAASAATINRFLRSYEIKQERDIYRLGGGLNLGPNWDVSVNYRQDDRDGAKLIGAVMGNTGGNPRAAILPYQLNDSTKQVEAVARYATRQAQLNLSYWYSKYDNDADSLTWQNPYNTIAGWVGNSGFPTGFGRLGLAPSNSFHQVQATGAWNFTPSTRLTGTLGYSRMDQDEAFLPYTINTAAQTPGTTLSVPNALPRSSLDGSIRNTLFDLSFFTRPIAKTTLRANYHYNKHDNRTPSDVYAYVGGDTTNQDPVVSQSVNSTRIRRNLPPGTTENKFKIDGDYEIFRRTLLRGWYEYKRTDYEESAVELRAKTDNNQIGAELRRVMSEYFTGAIRYARDERRGSDFSVSRPYIGSYTAAVVAATPFPDNVPTLRQYFVSDYDKNLVRAIGTFVPMERVSIDLRADWYDIEHKGPDCGGSGDQVVPGAVFPAECLGRTDATGQSYTLDASYTPIDGVSTFAFYTYSQYETDQLSRSHNGTNAQTTSTARDWGANLKYTDNTFGVGMRFQPENKRYDTGITYIYNDGTGRTSLSAGSALAAPLPVPDSKAKLHTLQLFAKYQYSKNIALRFNYWYERMRSDDWAFDNATPTSSNNVILTGQQSPNYDAHVFGVSVAYVNW